MAARKIEIDTKTLSGDIQRLRETLRQTRSHIRALTERMDSLNAMWSGTANQAMRKRFQEDRAALTELCDFLEKLINTLESAWQSYERCEGNVSDVVSSVKLP